MTSGVATLLVIAPMMRPLRFLLAMRFRPWQTDYPSTGEIMTTLGVAAGALLFFTGAVRNLPIHNEPPAEVAS